MSETLAWLDALYGKCSPHDGEIILIDPSKRKTLSSHRVGSGRALVEAAKAMEGNVGYYIKINLMDADAMRERSRRERKGKYIVGKASEVKTVVSFHLDVDADKGKYLSRQDMLDCLNRMPKPPSLIVNSDGDDGGFHVYWLLREPYRIESDDDRQRISELTQRWQERLNKLAAGKLDSTANIDRVLRVVGQRRQNGNLVSCHRYDPDALYSLDDFYVPPSDDEVKAEANRKIRAIVDKIAGPIPQGEKPIQAYIDAAFITPEKLLTEAGYEQLRDPLEFRRPGAASSGRSLKIATELDRPGINVFSGGDPLFSCYQRDKNVGKFYSVDEMFVILRHGGDWKDAARWCHREIERSQHPVNLEALTHG